MSRRHHRALLPLCLLLLPPAAAAEYSSSSSSSSSSKFDPDDEFGDYRGKWCLDDHGFVYAIGEVYYPNPRGCPCTCTVDGPVCVRPKCPRVHPRCTRVRYKACCPVCEAMARVCVYGGKTYRMLEEFRLSRCERCRCEANREVYCSVSECPAPHCVDPVYEPNHCCPVCKSGPNCFVGSRVIPAGERVNVDEHTVCFCTHRDGMWHAHPQATCEGRTPASPTTPDHRTKPSRDEEATGRAGRPAASPRMGEIP